MSNSTFAVNEFTLDGTIVHANDNFLSTLGYRLDEVVGRHHRMFVEPAYAASTEYAQFWRTLAAGTFQKAEYKRIAKSGKEVWIEASYNPIFDARGRVSKVVKFAIDVTEQKLRAANNEGQLAAINRAQAVIEFSLDGTILQANENFLSTLGYRLDEITGKHHSMFVDPTYARSPEYTKFWADLNAGTFQQAEYKRVGKGGRAGVAGLFRGVPMRLESARPRDLGDLRGFRFDLLQAEHIGLLAGPKFKEAFAEDRAQAVDVPGDEFHEFWEWDL